MRALTFVLLAAVTGPALAQTSPVPRGADYGTVRADLIRRGFTPIPSREPAKERCGFRLEICAAYPEAQSCAGTGRAPCSFAWRQPDGRTLAIGTEGEELSRLWVAGSRIAAAPAATPRPVAPAPTRAPPPAGSSASNIRLVLRASVVDGIVVVDGESNLPDGYQLLVTVKQLGGTYEAQAQAVMIGGEFRAGPFSNRSRPLAVGHYVAEVNGAVASVQSARVKNAIGHLGEHLSGPAVRRSDFGTFVETFQPFVVPPAPRGSR